MSAPLASCAESVLDAWIRLVETHKVQMAPLASLRAEFASWLDALGSTSLAERAELMRRVALHARELGADGKPASAALMQILLLEEAMRSVSCDVPPLVVPLREMARVVADAHALGAATRLRRQHHKDLAAAPIVELPDGETVAFMVGPLTADLIDAMVGRLLRAAAGAGANRIFLDVSAAIPEGDAFERSLEGFARGADFARFTLTVTGLEDPEGLRDTLAQRGVPEGRLFFFSRLADALAVNVP